MKNKISARERALRALRELLSFYRLDSPLKVFGRLGLALLMLGIFAVMFPKEFAEHWGKAVAGVIAYLIVVPIVYIFILRRTPKVEHIKIELSPLYTPEGRKKFREEERVKANRIAALEAAAKKIEAEMRGCDLTTGEGQQKFKQVARTKQEVDSELAALKASVRNIGFTGD